MSKIARKDFIALAMLFKPILNFIESSKQQQAVDIFVLGLKSEFSNFDEAKFRAYLKL